MTAPGEESTRDESRQQQAGESNETGERRVERPTRKHNERSREDKPGDNSWKLFARDIAVSLLAVALFGAYLFAISGVWPPLVAVESGSMSPNMAEDDLVFIMENERFMPSDATGDTGVVTFETGAQTGYSEFGDHGDVIVFNPNGDTDETPVIHRAEFWVEEGENWCDRADDAYLGNSNVCTSAPHAGFVTKGDANGQYDPVQGISEPVKPEWIVGTAEVRVPYLGWFRLQL